MLTHEEVLQLIADKNALAADNERLRAALSEAYVYESVSMDRESTLRMVVSDGWSCDGCDSLGKRRAFERREDVTHVYGCPLFVGDH